MSSRLIPSNFRIRINDIKRVKVIYHMQYCGVIINLMPTVQQLFMIINNGFIIIIFIMSISLGRIRQRQ